MIGIYFSGTGNTKHCLQQFTNEIDSSVSCMSIENENIMDEIRRNDLIVLAYPIYYSNLPKIVRDFIVHNSKAFADKNVFIIATMGLFSGDGAGCSARLLKRYDAKVIGGLHLKMPDCIGDEKLLKKTVQQNKLLVQEAQLKIRNAANSYKAGKPTQEGIGILYHLAGLFGQRLWFYGKTRNYSDKLKIDTTKCVGCGLCAQLCPLKNLEVVSGKAQTSGKCTMCYRCVSSCPQQAITLLGTHLYEQCRIEKYL